MSYIGRTPTPAALTASDITDGIVSNAKLAQDIISADTELAVAPASTDEFLVSDAGVLKRIDYSLISVDNTPSFLIYKSASDGDQSLSSGVATQVVMTGEIFDTDSACASSTFTVPSDGKYFFTCHATPASGNAANDSFLFMFYKNDAAVSFKRNYFVNAGVHSFEHSLILDLSATDTIKFYIEDDTDSVLDSDDAAIYTYMMGFKLIGV